MKISTLFLALVLGMTAMTACQNDAPQQTTPAVGETTTQPAPAPQDQAAQTAVPQPATTTVPGNTQPQIVPQGQVPPATAAPQPVAAGMNPAHGQPGHRCDIAVGAPLNSKPMPPKPQ